ncbi:MAG: glycerol-3-phosphate 1-O-acyltransferase PlsY [Bacteroidetes bacterium]|nr:glycerol-3-phosphate 1-O-acyltransferase PlsY [Bacteroidota bacterium]
MEIALSIAILLLPYLLGSINAAVIVSRGLYGVDIRTLGSLNAGSTNMFRELGFKAGALTQVVDIGKGCLSAALPFFAFWWLTDQKHWLSEFDLELQSIICGLLSVIGHLYPVYFGFKGGKGINTLLGMMLITNWQASLICLLGWILILYVSRYIAVASMGGVAIYPLYLIARALITDTPINGLLVAVGFGMALLVVYTHRSNIGRLLKGEEDKTTWFDGKLR